MRRKTARILLINDKQEILLFKTKEGKSITQTKETYWFTPGGGIEKDESIAEAAARELYEETGLLEEDIQIGPIVWQSNVELIIQGKTIFQEELFIVVHTNNAKITNKNFTEEEKQFIETAKWFSYEAILNCKEIIFPIKLSNYIEPIFNRLYPKKPIEITP